ncbi:MAG: sigma 54-interacting transcriptional regulator [Verrucomicrobia bacterium]|nr:sigma 54-interacting transcriptional regulator [Verrucomicrobiota bacterium]
MNSGSKADGIGCSLVFRSAAMRDAVLRVERVAPSDVPVFITGEAGTEKEAIADLIHATSRRGKACHIKINCAALPRDLIESELFGGVKGSTGGATTGSIGLFRLADGGTLFLDEISDMPVETQSLVLGVLQDQEVWPVGSANSYKTDCRIIASISLKSEEAIKAGKLREDLSNHLAAFVVHLPPLRERPEDILPLALSFLGHFAAQANRTIRGFARDAVERLTKYNWPGNTRQLQQEIQSAVLLSQDDEIQASDLFAPMACVRDNQSRKSGFS